MKIIIKILKVQTVKLLFFQFLNVMHNDIKNEQADPKKCQDQKSNKINQKKANSIKNENSRFKNE